MTVHAPLAMTKEAFLAWLDQPRAWLWQRANGNFSAEPDIVEGADKSLVLSALDLSIPLAEIYRGVR